MQPGLPGPRVSRPIGLVLDSFRGQILACRGLRFFGLVLKVAAGLGGLLKRRYFGIILVFVLDFFGILVTFLVFFFGQFMFYIFKKFLIFLDFLLKLFIHHIG